MFHPDIQNLTPFIPHSYADLMSLGAFRPEQMPEPAYEKICQEYAGVDDIVVERITYQHDDFSITGIIATPKAADAKRDLVIYNRGGCGNYGLLTAHAVMRQFVPLARAGYIVVGSNYRGNDSGTGKDEFGGHDVDDVMKLHDIMRSHPWVNKKPTFVVGHSRGGMMTYLLMKKHLPMRAAVAIAAIADLHGWQSARTTMRESVYTRFIPDFAQHEDESLIERSALHWPEKICAPLLLLHGMSDEAVPHSQSEALAGALQTHHKPHKLVLYENGKHALTSNWPDVMQQTLDWFEQHAA